MDGTHDIQRNFSAVGLSSWTTDRLIWVTGKGGTGKSTMAASIATQLARQGRRTLLCEIDAQKPAGKVIFGVEPTFAPQEIQPNLSIMNVTWPESLVAYLRTMLPVPRLVKAVLANDVVRRFMDFTPGSREIVALTVLAELRERYDVLVVDMPASGHAFGLFDITRSALSLFRGGPVRRKVVALRTMLTDAHTRGVFVALPEEMVINETIETWARFRNAGLLPTDPVFLLNRATESTRSDQERILLDRLAALSLDQDARDFVDVSRWLVQREDATTVALARLGEAVGRKPVVIPSIHRTPHDTAMIDMISQTLHTHLSTLEEG